MNSENFHFLDFLTGAPFSNCKVCGDSLANKPYMVEKALRNQHDIEQPVVVFEIALCTECVEDHKDSMSDDSKKQVQSFFEKNASPEIVADDSVIRMKRCMISGKSISEVDEVQYYGFFNQGNSAPPQLSYALSGEVIDQLVEVLSPETIGEIDNFMETHFGLPPEYQNAYSGRKLIFV